MKYTTANGSTVEGRGQGTFEVTTQEGHNKNITWENASVDLPILSTHKTAAENNILAYAVDGGVILNLTNGRLSKFTEAGGVYWQKLFVKKGLMSKSFHRPGGAA